MNNNLKVLLGAMIGAGVGYFVGQVIVEIIVIKQAESVLCDGGMEELEELEELTDDDADENFNILERNQTKLKKNNEKLHTKKNYTQYFKNQNRPDLAALAAKYNGEEPEPLSGNEEKDKEMVLEEIAEFTMIEDEAEKTDPSIISMSEFANAGDEYECLTLNYYDDDVVTDENDEPISKPEQILGEEALVSFGELSDDEDVVYVRNEKKKAMYEVVRTNKEYAAPKSRRRGKEHIDYDKEEKNGEDNIT